MATTFRLLIAAGAACLVASPQRARAAEPTAADREPPTAPPQQQATPPQVVAWRQAFAIDGTIAERTCPKLINEKFERVLELERLGDALSVVDDASIPEELATPPLMQGRFEGAELHAEHEETYQIEHLGDLNVRHTLRGRVSGDPNSRLEGTLTIRVSATPAHPEDKAISTRFQQLYGLPCAVKVALRGAAVPTPAVDRNAIMARWSLLKQHTDLLMMRQPEQAMVPLNAALEGARGEYRAALLWRKARAVYLTAEQLPMERKRERKRLFEEGMALATEALRLQPAMGEAAFFRAANLGRLFTTTLGGKLDFISRLEDFEKDCNTGIDRAQNNLFGFRVDGDAHFALGQFYRLLPDSWVTRTVLGTGGDLAKSISHLRRAVALQPTRGDYMKELGVSLLCYAEENDDDKARTEATEWLGQALDTLIYAYPPEVEHSQIRTLLRNPGDACEFSRDNYGAVADRG